MPSQNASFIHSANRSSSSVRHSGFRRQRSTDNFALERQATPDDTAGDRPISEEDFSPTAPGGQALVGERPVEGQPEEAFTVVPHDPAARKEQEATVDGVQVKGSPLRTSGSAESLMEYNQNGKH